MENLQQLRQRVDDYLTTALANSSDQATCSRRWIIRSPLVGNACGQR